MKKKTKINRKWKMVIERRRCMGRGADYKLYIKQLLAFETIRKYFTCFYLLPLLFCNILIKNSLNEWQPCLSATLKQLITSVTE